MISIPEIINLISLLEITKRIIVIIVWNNSIIKGNRRLIRISKKVKVKNFLKIWIKITIKIIKKLVRIKI